MKRSKDAGGCLIRPGFHRRTVFWGAAQSQSRVSATGPEMR
jgi:hypothetical protein